MGISCLGFVNMFRSVLVGLVCLSMSGNGEVLLDQPQQNDLKQLWSTFKFPDSPAAAQESNTLDTQDQEGRSYQPQDGDAREPRHFGGYGGGGGLNLCGGYGGGYGEDLEALEEVMEEDMEVDMEEDMGGTSNRF